MFVMFVYVFILIYCLIAIKASCLRLLGRPGTTFSMLLSLVAMNSFALAENEAQDTQTDCLIPRKTP